jgi:menaquinone-9 beta-reductase
VRIDHDVVIVGGGPAGLAAALFLVHREPRLKNRLVVVEKAHYPREKYCAGAIGGRAEMALSKIGVNVDVPFVPMRALSLRVPQGETNARGKYIGRVIRRVEFDHALAQIAQARGIRIEQGSKVNHIEWHPDHVRIHSNHGEIASKLVIGADGVGSVVRKALGLGTGLWRAQVLEVDTERASNDVPIDQLHFDASDNQFTGYEWDFPTMVHGNIMMCRGVYHLVLPGSKASEVDLSERLDRRLQTYGQKLSDYRKKRYAERGFVPYEPWAGPRVLLLGEAAGVDPITGEGIAQALLYGELAGKYLPQRLATNQLTFHDWPAFLQRSKLGIDMAIRHYLCQRFFGPAREFYEQSLVSIPGFLELGIQYFAGIPMSKKLSLQVAGRVMKRYWDAREQDPFQQLELPSG